MKTKLASVLIIIISLNMYLTSVNAQIPSTPPGAPAGPFEIVLQLKAAKERLAAAEKSLGEANTKIAALQADNTKLDLDLKKTQANAQEAVAQAEITLVNVEKKLETTLETAQTDIQKLISEKSTAKAAFEQKLLVAETSLGTTQAELAVVKAKLLAAQADLQAALEVKTETTAKNAVDDALFSRQPKGMAGVTPVAGEAKWVTSLRARIVKAKVDQAEAVSKGASEKALKGIQVALDSYQAAINRRMTPDQIAFILRFRDNGGLKQGDIDDLNEAIKASGGSNTTASSTRSTKSGTRPNLRPNN